VHDHLFYHVLRDGLLFEPAVAKLASWLYSLLICNRVHLQDVPPFSGCFASAMVVLLNCIQCGHESRFPPPFANRTLRCLLCTTPCQTGSFVRRPIDWNPIDWDPPLVFLPQWKDWTIKLLAKKVCRSKWIAYGDARTLGVLSLGFNYDI